MFDISVVVITYNHANYIKDTLKGIKKQVFNGEFEIVIHDDASDDGTQEIISEFIKNNPEMHIRPIFEKTNKYKNGEKIFMKTFKYASGKYLALCEGDDYWDSKNKLQLQYDFMETHEQYSYLVHSATMLIYKKNKIVKNNLYTFKNNCEFNLEEVLENGLIFPTASIFVKSKCLEKEPLFYKIAPIEDEPIKLLCLSKGLGYYMKDKMCVYRKNHLGSWNNTVKSNKKQRVNVHLKKIEMYNEFNNFTNKSFNKYIQQSITLENFNIIMAEMQYKKLKYPKYQKLIKGFPSSVRLRLKFAMNFPALYTNLIKTYKFIYNTR